MAKSKVSNPNPDDPIITVYADSVVGAIIYALRDAGSTPFLGTRTFSVNWYGNNMGLLIYNYSNRRFIITLGSEFYTGNMHSDYTNASVYKITLSSP